MSKMSVSASSEAKVLEILRSLVPKLQTVGLLKVADAGVMKDEDPTSFQVRVYNFAQVKEGVPYFTLKVEVRLNVEQAESANGGLFFDAHEKFAMWLERVMVKNGIEELETDEAYVDGMRRTGDDKDFDTATGEWFAVWDMTLSGRIKEQEVVNG